MKRFIILFTQNKKQVEKIKTVCENRAYAERIAQGILNRKQMDKYSIVEEKRVW